VTAAPALAPGLMDATAPPERRGVARDGVRLLVTDRGTRTNAHYRFFEIASVLRSGDLLVVNDSATVAAALTATRSSGDALAVHVATKIDERLWTCEPRGPVVNGERLNLPEGGSLVAIAAVDERRPRLWYAAFDLPQPMHEYLARWGEPVRYGYVTEHLPLRDYQTIFAREAGSSEMPSAGRPFTRRVLRELRERSVGVATITLHCGVASFETPERPAMERFAVPAASADAINHARADGRRVIAVGTTVVRALETAALADGEVVPASGWTDLALDEGYELRAVDGLLSGFHDASATHIGILRAFLDRELLGDAYADAAERAYVRHEFGDVHLIL